MRRLVLQQKHPQFIVEPAKRRLGDRAAGLQGTWIGSLPEQHRRADHQAAARRRQLKQQERQIADLKRKLATGGGSVDLMSRVREVGGIKLLATRVDGGDPRTLREAGDQLRNKLGSGLVVLGGEHEGKATLLVMVSKDLTGKLHAGKIVRELARVIDGRGGGRPDMAQAGGPGVDRLDDALARVPELIG